MFFVKFLFIVHLYPFHSHQIIVVKNHFVKHFHIQIKS